MPTPVLHTRHVHSKGGHTYYYHTTHRVSACAHQIMSQRQILV